MTKPTFDRDFWEQLWSKTLREGSDYVPDPSKLVNLSAPGPKPGFGSCRSGGAGAFGRCARAGRTMRRPHPRAPCVTSGSDEGVEIRIACRDRVHSEDVFACAMFDVTATTMPLSRPVISDITVPPPKAAESLPNRERPMGVRCRESLLFRSTCPSCDGHYPLGPRIHGLPADRGGHFAVLATGVGAWI